eukprot:gene18659-biopygen6933
MEGVLQGHLTRPNSDRFGRVATGTRPNIPDTSAFQRIRTRQKRNINAFVRHVFDASDRTRCERARADALLARPTVHCPSDLPEQATTVNALPAWTCLFTREGNEGRTPSERDGSESDASKSDADEQLKEGTKDREGEQRRALQENGLKGANSQKNRARGREGNGGRTPSKQDGSESDASKSHADEQK